jgi:predicted dehydrogenase
MVHKATHHFDLVNWWLSASPVEVFAALREWKNNFR